MLGKITSKLDANVWEIVEELKKNFNRIQKVLRKSFQILEKFSKLWVKKIVNRFHCDFKSIFLKWKRIFVKILNKFYENTQKIMETLTGI